MILLLWDIDGTLLTTEKTGAVSWERAASHVLNRSFELSSLKTEGKTDMEIGIMIMEKLDVPYEDSLLRELVSAYCGGLPRALREGGRGRVLPGVREILDFAEDRHDTKNMLLTGNTNDGANAKLTHYGLSPYFDAGAFSHPLVSRTSIAELARDIARENYGVENADHMYVIGDTPADIHCGKHIQARTIAVASGTYSFSQLESHEPWWCLERLPSPADFFRVLEEPGRNERAAAEQVL